MTDDICVRENLARQQGCIEAMKDDIHELKEGVAALRKYSQETWKTVSRIEAKMDSESNKRRNSNPCEQESSPSDITLSLRQVVVIITAFVVVILIIVGCDVGALI